MTRCLQFFLIFFTCIFVEVEVFAFFNFFLLWYHWDGGVSYFETSRVYWGCGDVFIFLILLLLLEWTWRLLQFLNAIAFHRRGGVCSFWMLLLFLGVEVFAISECPWFSWTWRCLCFLNAFNIIEIEVHTQTHARACTHAHTQTHIHTHSRMHKNTHTRTHTNTRFLKKFPEVFFFLFFYLHNTS